MQITFLGTSAMVPTKERNHPGFLLSYKDQGILFDCGENIQRQLKIAGISPTKITKILISHWHGDHVLGLPGLIQTLGNGDYERTLKIYGPAGTKEFMKNVFKAFVFDKKLIEIEVEEVKDGVFFENKDFKLEAFEMEHGIKTVGYSFIEEEKRKINLSFVKKLGIPDGPLLGKLQANKSITWKGKKVTPKEAAYVVEGRKLAYIPDTLPCKNCVVLAKDADILVCEATYTSELEEKAEEYRHLTAKQAAIIASQAGVKKLVLTHFSQRYKNTQELEEDAKTYFSNVLCAKDFMKIKM